MLRRIAAMALLWSSHAAAQESEAPSAPQRCQSVLDHAATPGVAAVVLQEDGEWTGASGFADLRRERAMGVDTPVYIGSLSKPLTAMLALLLREEGQLDPDATLDRYLPRWRIANAGDQIRVRHLLTHTSGLSRAGGLRYWFTGRFPGRPELRRELRTTQLERAPGERYGYSNTGYALLGQVLRASARRPYAALLRTHVLERLGMQASGVGRPRGLARAYTAPGQRTGRGDEEFAGHGRQVGERFERVYHHADAMTPAFGVHSTARDLARFAAALLRPGRVPDAVRRDMLALQHPFAQDETGETGWTFGLRRTRDDHGLYLRHNGWFAAYRSHLQLRVEEGIAAVVVTNSDDGDPEGIGNALVSAAREGCTAER